MLRRRNSGEPFQGVDVHGKVSGYITHIYVDICARVREARPSRFLRCPSSSHSWQTPTPALFRVWRECVAIRADIYSPASGR
jgi:hypothetical protein